MWVKSRELPLAIASALRTNHVTSSWKVWLLLQMSNLASPNEGASVLLASSNDDGFPADAIIDG